METGLNGLLRMASLVFLVLPTLQNGLPGHQQTACRQLPQPGLPGLLRMEASEASGLHLRTQTGHLGLLQLLLLPSPQTPRNGIV